MTDQITALGWLSLSLAYKILQTASTNVHKADLHSEKAH